MKKRLLFLLSAIVPLIMSAEYKSMTFRLINGEETTISADNLKMTFDDSVLKVKSGDVEVTFELVELASMQFSDNPSSSISEADASYNQEVIIYSIDGIESGNYNSLNAAFNSLGKGIYVAKFSKGQTIKFTVR